MAAVTWSESFLAAFFRDTALPRTWRFVARLPEDAQGKASLAALEELFRAPPPPLAAPVPRALAQ